MIYKYRHYIIFKDVSHTFNCRNILALMNAFDLPEGNVTTDNYDQVVTMFNSTSPDVIQTLHLKTCNLNTFLSEVLNSSLAFSVLETMRHKQTMILSPMTAVTLSSI